MNFNNQVVVVTGGTRGIGKGISQAFLKEGATVIATYANNDSKAQEFRATMGDLGEKLLLKKFNVASYDECETFWDAISEQFEQIHVLVNNSGVRKDNLAASMSEQQWDDVLDINLKGTFNMSKLAILKMMKKRYGRIVNISSIGGSIGLAGQGNYAASKAGQIAFSKSVSKEVAKRNITINNVCPGFIETELLDDLDDKLINEYKKEVPMKRFGTTEDVANAVLFLASDKASYITGASLEVTGGL